MFTRNPATKEPQKRPIMYFDLMGYVSYVGIIQRMKNFDCECDVFKAKNLKKEQNEDDITEYVRNDRARMPFRQFSAFRWIQLIDKDSTKPVL